MSVKLYNGDCLEIMPTIPDKSIDMILCDLPYGTTACKWDNIIPFEPLWKEYNRIIKKGGCIALFGSEPFSSHLRMSNIKNYKYDWIWKKSPFGFLLSKKQPMRNTENISIFYDKQCLFNQVNFKKVNYKRHGKHCKTETMNDFNLMPSNQEYNGWAKHRTLIEHIKKENTTKILAPTQKPVALLEYLIHTYTKEGETVLDNCMGSGSTGVACVNTKRNFIGIEKEETYFKMAKKRIDESIENKQPDLFKEVI